jgi:type III restriction enzyme
LTATPRDKSNVISFVNAARLKKANMVKLPVIVYNLNSATEVLFSAVKLQENLEKKAVEEEKKGGKYIRPIVLLQAQPKSKDDSITFEQIKKKLLSWNIPENQIKIKTANVDEIKNINLMGRDCPVRFIITVNALKEGWDCPFAYILASLANKTSRIDVEQILGRILRQPYTKQHQTRLLNLSYVLTSSSYFLETVDNIVDGLNKAGFGKRDYRVASEKQMAAAIARPKEPSLFDEQTDDLILENETVSFDDPVNQSTISDAVKDIEENAEAEGEKYEAAINENNDTSNIPDLNTSTINECFASAKELVLPQFVMPVKYDNTFFQEDKEVLVTKEALIRGKDTKLPFLP